MLVPPAPPSSAGANFCGRMSPPTQGGGVSPPPTGGHPKGVSTHLSPPPCFSWGAPPPAGATPPVFFHGGGTPLFSLPPQKRAPPRGAIILLGYHPPLGAPRGGPLLPSGTMWGETLNTPVFTQRGPKKREVFQTPGGVQKLKFWDWALFAGRKFGFSLVLKIN